MHSERLKLQFMCEDDKYEQEKFQQWNQHLIENSSMNQQETDEETDTDIDDEQVIREIINLTETMFLFRTISMRQICLQQVKNPMNLNFGH